MEKKQEEKGAKKTELSIGGYFFLCFMFVCVVFGFVAIASPILEFFSEKTGIYYEYIQTRKIENGIIQATMAAKRKIYFKAEKARKKFTRKYDTTAAWQLDTEYDAYPMLNQNHYRIIDDAIDHVKNEIARQKNWQNMSEVERANVVFVATHNFLKKYHKNSIKAGETLLSRGLDWKSLDCDTGSVIYLSVGEALGLPIVVVHVPKTSSNGGHMFVRWKIHGGSYLNWETTGRGLGKDVRMSNEEYQVWLGSKKFKIEFLVYDTVGYREEWKRQLHFAYNKNNLEGIVKSIMTF